MIKHLLEINLLIKYVVSKVITIHLLMDYIKSTSFILVFEGNFLSDLSIPTKYKQTKSLDVITWNNFTEEMRRAHKIL